MTYMYPIKKLAPLILCLFFSSNFLIAQDYSYLSDKKFREPSDLIGYNFVPSIKEIQEEGKKELRPDEYSFGISRTNLYVSGNGIKGLYNVNNINTTEYGFKLALINARDPRQQGHLKVILLKGGYVDALVFRKSKDEQEAIFFLAQKSKEKAKQDKAYFTGRYERIVEDQDSIWGTKVIPMFRIYTDKGNTHERLQAVDSVSISFIEEIEIIEKIKKKRKKKKKKKEKEEILADTIEETEEERSEETNELTGESTLEESTDEEEEIEKKIKIIKKYFVEVRGMRRYQDGTEKDETERFKVKKIKEREDTEATGKAAERYQLELETEQGTLYVYLTAQRSISSIEIANERYLMQGH